MNSLAPAASRPQLHPDVLRNWGAAWLKSDSAGVHGGVAMVRFPSGPSQDVDELRHGLAYYEPSRIRSPTLLIRGEWDSWPSDRDFRGLLGRLRNAPYKKYVVIPRGTHVMHLEAARVQLYDEVLRFLR
jgi:pimeloyl-ACP methyl ester carboxylesterase